MEVESKQLGPNHHLQVGSRWAMPFGVAKSGLGAYTGNHIIFLSIFHSIFHLPLAYVELGSQLWLSESCDNIAFFSSFSSYSDNLRSPRSLRYPSSDPAPLPPLLRSPRSLPAPRDSCFILWTLSGAFRFVFCISLMLVSFSAHY